MARISIAVLLLALASKAWAQQIPAVNVAGGYYVHCVLMDPNKPPDIEKIVRCSQYLAGVDEGIAAANKFRGGGTFCISPSADFSKRSDAFEDFLRANQTRWQALTADLYLVMLLQTFPCPVALPPAPKRM